MLLNSEMKSATVHTAHLSETMYFISNKWWIACTEGQWKMNDDDDDDEKRENTQKMKKKKMKKNEEKMKTIHIELRLLKW